MGILYNITIQIFKIAAYIFSLFNKKAELWVKGRKLIFEQISEAIKEEQNIVWFHCASLGEFEQGRHIIETYKKISPKHKILLTFFSPSGYEIRKNYKVANWIFYLPLDTKSNARKFISITKPIKVIFIKYEFWFNYMNELKKRDIPLYSTSTIFRDDQIFFKYRWFSKQLKNVSHFFVQDQNSKNLLKNIGIENSTVTGDTRFDSVIANTKNKRHFRLIEEFCKNKTTIIFGSTWPKDEILIEKYIKKNPNKNYVIAPHELQNIYALKKNTNGLLFSEAESTNILNRNVIIIDSIGILSDIYKYGDIAYIGGGFGSGIHNILEAAAFGLPIIFGPKYQKYKEAIELINLKGALSVSDYKELSLAINTFNNFDKSITKNYIKKNIGATKRILNHIIK